MTAREDLQTAYDAMAAELAALDLRANINVDGQSEDNQGHRASLIQNMKDIQELLASPASNGGQPINIETKFQI